MAMMAITTSNSISVNPRFRLRQVVISDVPHRGEEEKNTVTKRTSAPIAEPQKF
jgi:hypothetical protein